MARKATKTVKLEDQIRDAAEVTFDDVMTAARRWYYTEIRSLADDAIARLKTEGKNARDAREWLTEDINQTTDGHAFVIYTAQAGMVCAASDCDSTYEDELGEKPPTVEAQACMAMRADIWQLLEARSDEWETSADSDSDGE